MIIGSFAKVDEGYTGSPETGTPSMKARITPAEKRSDNAPRLPHPRRPGE